MNIVVLFFAFVDDVAFLFRNVLQFFSYQHRHDKITALFEQAHFLLCNVFEEDVHCPVARQELKLAQHSASAVETVMHLYAAYAAFSEFARESEDLGYEISATWLTKLSCANQHIFEKLFPTFSKYDQTLLYHNFPRLYRAAAKATYHFDENGKIIAGDTSDLDDFKLQLE